MKTTTLVFALLFLQLFNYRCSGKQDLQESINNNPVRIYPKIVSVIPHDSSAFTQGLFYNNGKLYESTGLYNQSSLRILDTNGTILRKIDVSQVFAEGITLFENNLYQLTWKNQFAIIYSFPDLTSKGTVSYQGEGWGLTSNNSSLILSNGSDTLYYMNPGFEITNRVAVTCNGTPLENLNELEYAKNNVYANVWYSDYIFEISHETGIVTKIIDCSQIVAQEQPISRESVLNGIAYNRSTNLFYITGKNWKHIYLIKII